MTDMLRAVLALPEDDLARSACADWYDEQGDAARAHFIRLQVALHQRPELDPEAVDLSVAAETLLAGHERTWLGDWADRLIRWKFRRGFLDSVCLTPEAFLRHGEELFARHPVREVRFLEDNGEPCGPDAVEELVNAPAFALVRALDASGGGGGPQPHAAPAWCRALASHPETGRLEELNLSSGWRSDAAFADLGALEALCQAEHLRGLRKLDLSAPLAYAAPGDEVVSPLLGSAFAPRLTSLRLAGLLLSDAGLAQLASDPVLSRLEALDVGWAENLSAAGLRALLRSRTLPRLQELSLGGDIDLTDLAASPLVGQLHSLDLLTNTRRYYRLTPAQGWAAFARSPQVARLRRLGLLFRLIDGEGAEALLGDESRLQRLRTLIVMGQNGDGEAFAGCVARSPALRGLTSLELPGCQIPTAGLRALLGAPFIAQLKLFCVAGNPLEPSGLQAVASSPLGQGRLADLHLHHCQLPAGALCELFRWPGLRHVVHLEVGSEALQDGVLAALARSPCAGRLTGLEVSDGPVEADGLDRLLDTARLPRLRQVKLPASVDAGAVSRLRARFGARLTVEAPG